MNNITSDSNRESSNNAKYEITQSNTSQSETSSKNKTTPNPNPNPQTIDKSKDILLDNYVILEEVGKGAFGQIYLSYNMRDNTEVAVKKEMKKKFQRFSQVKNESKVYQELLSISQNLDLTGLTLIKQENVQGVPKFYGVGETIETHYLIMEFLGPNLNELIHYCGNKKFSIITVSLLAIQMLNRIEYLHKHNYIHRDIKPENFLIGTNEKSNILYLIDFGLSKRYRNIKTHSHIPYKEGRSLTGTARYVSINTHLGIEQSRRDDLESIGYVLIFFLKGYLPWQGLKHCKNKYEKIKEKKLQIPTEILCFGLPQEIVVYLNYCKNLKFEDRPNYDYIRGLFIRLLVNSSNTYGISKDNLKFDWCFEDRYRLMEIFQMKKEDSSIEDDIYLNLNPNKQKITPGGESGNKSKKNNKSNKENKKKNKNKINGLTMIDEEQKKINISDDEGDNESESSDSQNTIKVNFHGLKEETDNNVNGILNSMIHTEKIDKYIDTIIQKSEIKKKYEKIKTEIEKKPNVKKDIELETRNILKKSVKNHTLNPQPISMIKKFEDLEEKNDESTENVKYHETRKNENFRSPWKHLTDSEFKKNIELILQKEQYIKINKEKVTNYYQILDDLGHGTYGSVKKVLHKQLNEFRAMKIVNKRLHSSNNEIEILRKISHPNIVNIFEIFEDKKKYYIMSEFCDGGELLTAISEKGFFNEFEASRIMKQLLETINYLHSINIVHRDIKPENIMLMSNGIDIKLIDFGTSIELPKRKKLTKLIGTSYYLAPEVISQNYDEKCDVWSSGIILHILLCGYPPFNGPSNNDIYSAIQHSKLLFKRENWTNISKEAIRLIKRMLDKNPKKRPSALECLNDFWFQKLSFNKDVSVKFNKLEILERMAQFVQQNKFKQAVLQFISTQFNLKKEEENLREVFKSFDKENKGVISKKDFVEQIDNIYGGIISVEISNMVFNNLDLDNSGEISYNEFLTAVIDSQKILTEDRLKKAFDMFDKDGSGALDINEIKVYFGGNDETWKKVLKDIDLNGDGQVDFEEFKKMMIGMNPSEIVAENTVGKDD